MGKRVEVIFGKDGSITGQAFGFSGPVCEEKTKFISDEFGTEKVLHKPSYDEIEDKSLISENLPNGHCG